MSRLLGVLSFLALWSPSEAFGFSGGLPPAFAPDPPSGNPSPGDSFNIGGISPTLGGASSIGGSFGSSTGGESPENVGPIGGGSSAEAGSTSGASSSAGSTGIESGGSNNPMPTSLGGLNLGKSEKTTFFEKIGFSFWEENLNYKIISQSSKKDEKSCQNDCVKDNKCVLAVLCNATDLSTTTTPASAQPPGLGGGGMFLPSFSLKTSSSSKYTCIWFEKTTEDVAHDEQERSSWGSDCKYVYINPKCRSFPSNDGWLEAGTQKMAEEHAITQPYVCDVQKGYTPDAGTPVKITCSSDGNFTLTGGCSLDDSEEGAAISPNGNLPQISTIGGGSGFGNRPEDCADGYKIESSGQCEDIDECSSGDLCGNGACINNEGSYTCDCVQGYKFESGQCEDIDECSSGDLCSNGACINNEGSYTCDCVQGYKFEESGQCEDIDECSSGDVCGNGACINNEGSYTCDCVQGYIFEESGRCKDIDECSSGDVCGNGACINNEGSYTCDCVQGYKFESGQCEDIDECSSEGLCGNGACINNEGSYTCDCVQGYKFESGRCEDEDECESDSHECHSEATCVNNDGSYTCSCNDGFNGDGRNCEENAHVCPTPEFSFDEKSFLCFKIIMENLKQSLCSTFCENDIGYDNSRMAILNTQEKIDAVSTWSSENGFNDDLWIDIKQDSNFDYFRDIQYDISTGLTYETYTLEDSEWGDGTTVSRDLFEFEPYNHWDKCVKLNSAYKFEEMKCAEKMPFVCEIPVPHCPEPYHYDPGTHFCFLLKPNELVDRDTAEQECIYENGHLAYVSSPDREKAVFAVMEEVDSIGPVWVGAKAIDPRIHMITGEWPNLEYWTWDVNHWGDESPIHYKLWNDWVPDDKECVTQKSKKLISTSCDALYGYVCEITQ